VTHAEAWWLILGVGYFLGLIGVVVHVLVDRGILPK
jgi:hypothetical protein